jgi:DNA-binding SARP family transcriptional activator
MEFGILGSLAAWEDGCELPLGGPKQRALLAVLLLRANELVPMESLVDELWGERPPRSAIKVVHGHVSQLRKALGEGILETRAAGYVLRVGPGALDVERFEGLLERGRRLLAEGDAEQAARLLREGLALWRGPALAEFRYDAFARNEIGRLEELRVVALGQRLEADLALGRGPEVMWELEALVREHPQRESLCGLLMLALYRAGRQADALTVYQGLRARLVDQLGLEPSPALQRLEKAILIHDPALDAAVESAPEPAAAASRPHAASNRRIASLVFCDVDPYTERGEHVDPESLRLLMSRCFEVAASVVARRGGTLGGFAGGGVMAVFGAPLVREDDALRALRTAVEIRDALASLGVRARIGVSSGEVVAAAQTGRDALVVGEAVAVGKRLQEAAAVGEVLIGELTRVLVRDAAQVDPVAPLHLQGRPQPVPAFRVLQAGESPERPRAMRFVGRERELGLVQEIWGVVRTERRCELVTIVADAGVGKSRLAAEALASMDALVVRGRCLPYGEGISYWPVLEVLRQLPSRAPDEAARVAIGSLLGETEAVTSAEEIAWAFRKTLEHVAGSGPIVVVFDDLQWADQAVLDLIEHTALLSSGAAILLLCMARPELPERRATWPVTLRVEPLRDEEIEALIPADIARTLRARIVRAAGGNPLFVEEMLAFTGEAEGDVVVPPTLQALLAARLDRLEPAERVVLERAAVEGEIFHRAAVQALTPDEAQLTPRLAALARKGLIRCERAEHAGEDAFRFCHVLVRDAAYEALAKATRAELHERLADWLEAYEADLVERDEIVGHHLEMSYRYRTELRPLDEETRALGRRAAGRLLPAGRRAIARGDLAAAANLLERALALGIDDPGERVRAQVELGNALGETGRIADADALLAEAHDAAAGLGERALSAHAQLYRLTGHSVDPELDRAELQQALRHPLETFGELRDERGLALTRRLLAAAIGLSSSAGVVELERALVHADAADDKATRRRVIGTLCASLSNGPMPVGAAIARCEELLASSRNDQVLEAVLKLFLGEFHAMAGRFEEGIELVRQSTLVLDELSRLTVISQYRYESAYAKELAGDRAGAEHELTTRWSTLRDSGCPGVDRRAIEAAYQLARFYCDEGRWDDADRFAAHGREVPMAAHTGVAVTRQALEARLAAHRGRLAEAVTLAQRAVDGTKSWEPTNAKARIWLALAEVRGACGDTAEADAAVATALELYERKGNIAAAARLRAGSCELASST